MAKAASALVAFTLAGAAHSAAALDTVRVGTPAAEPYIFSLLDVGAETGIFTKHGIAMKRIDFEGGGKLAQGMTAGSIDMALSGGTDLVFIAKGMPAKGVAVVLAAPVDMAIIVRAGGAIAAPNELEGKSLGVTTESSLTAWLATDFARHEGWGSSGVKLEALGTATAAVAALKIGNIDGFIGPSEMGYALEAKGDALPLVTFDYLQNFLTHILYARDSMIATEPETVRRFVAAWFDTVAFARAHKEEAIRLSAKRTNLAPALAAKVYDEQTPALSADGRFAPQALAAVAQSFVDMRLVAAPPPLENLYTEKFLP